MLLAVLTPSVRRLLDCLRFLRVDQGTEMSLPSGRKIFRHQLKTHMRVKLADFPL